MSLTHDMPDQLRMLEHNQILGIVVLSRRREIEAAGDDPRGVDYHHLVVRDGDCAVDPDGHTSIGEICRRRVARAALV